MGEKQTRTEQELYPLSARSASSTDRKIPPGRCKKAEEWAVTAAPALNTGPRRRRMRKSLEPCSRRLSHPQGSQEKSTSTVTQRRIKTEGIASGPLNVLNFEGGPIFLLPRTSSSPTDTQKQNTRAGLLGPKRREERTGTKVYVWTRAESAGAHPPDPRHELSFPLNLSAKNQSISHLSFWVSLREEERGREQLDVLPLCLSGALLPLLFFRSTRLKERHLLEVSRRRRTRRGRGRRTDGQTVESSRNDQRHHILTDAFVNLRRELTLTRCRRPHKNTRTQVQAKHLGRGGVQVQGSSAREDALHKGSDRDGGRSRGPLHFFPPPLVFLSCSFYEPANLVLKRRLSRPRDSKNLFP